MNDRLRTRSNPTLGKKTSTAWLLACCLSPIVAGCEPPGGTTPPPEPPQATSQAPAAPQADASSPHSTPSIGPVTSRTTAPAAAPGAAPAPLANKGGTINAPGAYFDLPAGWAQEAPSSSMRLAQATIPGSAGPGQLTVFYFGPGGGGPIEDNLQRWVGQMEAKPGTSPQRGNFALDNFRVHWIEVEGTVLPSTMGVGPTTAQPGSRLLGAVVEGAQGPWFFKATGPDKTLAEQRDAFLGMVRSARPNL
jgi:hypothetical protein